MNYGNVTRSLGRLIWSGSLVALFVLSSATAPRAAEIVVDAGCTLANAIVAANTDAPTGMCTAGEPGRDTILITGDVNLDSVDNEIDGANGLPPIEGELLVDGLGRTVQRVDTAPEFRIFHIQRGSEVRIQNLTISGGVASAGGKYGSLGGGVWNRGELVLSNTTLRGNSADGNGGGIYSSFPVFYYGGTALEIENSEFLNNVATDGGGGIWLAHPATIRNTTVSGNRAGSSAGLRAGSDYRLSISGSLFDQNVATEGNGGAIGATGMLLTLIDSEVLNNEAAIDGGGLNLNQGINIVADTVISGNVAGFDGGGINLGGNGTLIVEGSEVTGNRARDGGGLRVDYVGTIQNSTISGNLAEEGGGGASFSGGYVTLDSVTLSGNRSLGIGGGIETSRTELEIVNSTISGNSALEEGGALNNRIGAEFVDIRHSTLSGNSSPAIVDVNQTSEITIGSSIVADSGGVGCAEVVNDDGGNFSDDATCGPGFGLLTGFDTLLGDHGGDTQTHPLSASSSAVDAIEECLLEIDQRRFSIEGPCDAGAYEFGGEVVPYLTAAGLCGNDLAVAASGFSPGGSIGFVISEAEGESQVIAGSCAGTPLDLASPTPLQIVQADDFGRFEFQIALDDNLCDQYVQAIDVQKCEASNVVQMP